MVVGEGLAMVAAGIVVGVVAALAVVMKGLGSRPNLKCARFIRPVL